MHLTSGARDVLLGTSGKLSTQAEMPPSSWCLERIIYYSFELENPKLEVAAIDKEQ